MKTKSKILLYAGFIILIFIIPISSGLSDDAVKGEAIFHKLCVACHTIGKGKLVGPDLERVAERRDTSWMKGFIQSPSSFVAKGDEIAKTLLKEYGVPMPDLGLTTEDVEAVIKFLTSDKKPEKTIVPSQFIPTLVISIAGVFLLTIIGLIAGNKKVEVRK